MNGRTLRHVVVARCNQGLAGTAGGQTTATARASTGTPGPLTPLASSWRWIASFILAISLVLPAPLTAADDLTSCLESLASQTPVTAVHVQPGAGHAPVLDEITHARCTIDLSMYFFTDQTIVDGLAGAVDRGVRVRVILDRQPFGTFGDQQEMFDQLVSIGAEVKWSPEAFTFSHAKYMVVDSAVLVVTNQNFTGAGFESNREFGAITTEPAYVQEAQAVFDADWTGAPPTLAIEHLVVSPENARVRVLELIGSANTSLWMYSEVLRDEEITAALSAAADRGVDVRIIVNPTADEDDVPYFLDALGHGVQIRMLRSPYVHAKVMIVDGERALVGSQNYSFTSLNLNREVGMVIDQPLDLQRMVAVYVGDWERAEPVDTVGWQPRWVVFLDATRVDW